MTYLTLLATVGHYTATRALPHSGQVLGLVPVEQVTVCTDDTDVIIGTYDCTRHCSSHSQSLKVLHQKMTVPLFSIIFKHIIALVDQHVISCEVKAEWWFVLKSLPCSVWLCLASRAARISVLSSSANFQFFKWVQNCHHSSLVQDYFVFDFFIPFLEKSLNDKFLTSFTESKDDHQPEI